MGVPVGAALNDRLDSVLGVLYLMFNEGYLSTDPRNAQDGGEAPRLIREDLSDEAIRLCRMLALNHTTDLPKVRALLALFLLQSSRFASRLSTEGELLVLADQDRTLWDRARIEEGMLYLSSAAEGTEESEFHLEAAIAAAHATSGSIGETDWSYIAELYDALFRRKPTPVVALNRAVAIAYSEGPLAGLAALDTIGSHPALAGYHLLPAARAHFHEMAGEAVAAAENYRKALDCECSTAERRFLEGRLQRLIDRSSSDLRN